MKYIMLEVKVGGISKLVPIIFPDFMCHVDLAVATKSILESEHKLSPIIFVSAGDIDIDVNSCSGKSTTLNIKSRRSDKNIINSYDYLHGIVNG